jgi:hypothetical protein
MFVISCGILIWKMEDTSILDLLAILNEISVLGEKQVGKASCCEGIVKKRFTVQYMPG